MAASRDGVLQNQQNVDNDQPPQDDMKLERQYAYYIDQNGRFFGGVPANWGANHLIVDAKQPLNKELKEQSIINKMPKK